MFKTKLPGLSSLDAFNTAPLSNTAHLSGSGDAACKLSSVVMIRREMALGSSEAVARCGVRMSPMAEATGMNLQQSCAACNCPFADALSMIFVQAQGWALQLKRVDALKQ
jgi:hypothetical protein